MRLRSTDELEVLVLGRGSRPHSVPVPFPRSTQPTAAQSAAIPPVATVPTSLAPTPAPPVSPGAPLPGHSTIVVRVLDESGVPLGQQVVVQLWLQGATPVYSVTQPPSEARFDALQAHQYTVIASAPGYEVAKSSVQTFPNDTFYQDVITLKRKAAAAAAADANDPPLVDGAKKEAQKGLADNEAGNFQGASAQFDKAFKLAPEDPEPNFLLGASLLQSNDLQSAQSLLQHASSLDPKYVPSLVALGRARVQQGDYQGATIPLKQATSIDPKQWSAHWLLGSVYLVQREFAKAAQEAENAIRLGKGSANGAQLVLGEALAALGKRDQAQQALTSFVREQPESPAARGARHVINTLQTHALIENQDVNKAVLVEAAQTSARSIPVSADIHTEANSRAWRPLPVNEVKPLLADGITCPATATLDGTTQRVGELVDNVNRFAATEEVLHQDLNASGKVLSTDTASSITSYPSTSFLRAT